MRIKEGVDDWSIDDLFNNLRVFEQDIKGSSKPYSSAANVAFVGQGKTSTNKVSSGIFYSGSFNCSSNNAKERNDYDGFADEVIYSLFEKRSDERDLIHNDLDQIDDTDIEEMDINWQLAKILQENWKKHQIQWKQTSWL